MKKFLSFILFCLFGCMMVFVSCSKDTEGGESNKPFSKAVEMVLHAVADEAKDIVQSRGLIKYSEFDLNYDPTSVFLHIGILGATEPFPTEMFRQCGDKIRKIGAEIVYLPRKFVISKITYNGQESSTNDPRRMGRGKTG
jgi:hypothetical protein